MKIPNQVRIAGTEYDVEYVPNLVDGTAVLYGQIDYEDSKIYLSDTRGTGHQKRCRILLHEILHGIMHHADLDIDIETEEKVCIVLANGLYQVLQDNGGRLFDLRSAKDDDKEENESTKETVD